MDSVSTMKEQQIMSLNQLDPARYIGGVAAQPRPSGQVTPTRVTQDRAREGELKAAVYRD